MKYVFFLSIVFFISVLFLAFNIAERELANTRDAASLEAQKASLGGD